MAPSPLIITGMHRSGTSLLASAMQRAGVEIGDELLGASRSNPKGHFEDRAFLELHEAIFADHGVTVVNAHERMPLEVSPARRREAEALVAARRDRPLWGWKDPRTCLFLDFWAGMLPGARFLFIVRDPNEVVASLKARGQRELERHFRGAWLLRKLGIETFRRDAALRWWLAYNEAIVAFARREPDRCRTIEAAAIGGQLPRAIAAMRDGWGMPLRDVDLAEVFDPELMRSGEVARGRLPERVRTVLGELRGLAGR